MPAYTCPMSTPALPQVLLTGFAPFGGESVNPSWQAVQALHNEIIAGHRVRTRCLPVEFDAAIDELRRAIRTTRPALVLCVGQAGGRSAMSLERVAINVDDARIPDNAGARPIDRAVVEGGPAAYFTDLPIKAMLVALREARIPAEVSQTAGTFVCNHVFYGLMHALRRRTARGGFIHIPYSPGQAAAHPGAPSLEVGIVQEGLRLALHVALTTTTDASVAAGTEH